MKSIGNKELNYSLQNSENFKKEIENEITDVVKKLSELFVDYFKFITENIKLKIWLKKQRTQKIFDKVQKQIDGVS